MPIFSLPTKYGIGDFGKSAYKFIDFLSQSGQKVWQVLPLVQTGYGNSPYSSISSQSYNPYFISPELLREQGLITKSELEFSRSEQKYVNYAELYAVRYPLLRSAFNRFDKQDKAFQKYLRSKEGLNYALFMAIKFASGQKHFYEWDEPLKRRDERAINAFKKSYKEELLFWQFVQFTAKTQWLNLKKYANQKGVLIMGDMPLYVALDSVDVWENPTLFKLDENFNPKKVAGVPPDYFSQDGQLWGNPVYDYIEHNRTNFAWWTQRIKRALTTFDYVRIDHFRGLDRYYEIEPNRKDAKVGEWIDVPSEALFNAIHLEVDKDRIIAEDLGIIDDGVRELLKWTGYPGMKILSFAFDGHKDNLYLPENIKENSVCYTGTHDNDTLKGLIDQMNEWDYNNLINGVKQSLIALKLNCDVSTKESLIDAIIVLGMHCKSKLFIMPMQDLMHKGTEHRVNEPGTVKDQNWAVKADSSDFNAKVRNKLLKLTKQSNRI